MLCDQLIQSLLPWLSCHNGIDSEIVHQTSPFFLAGVTILYHKSRRIKQYTLLSSCLIFVTSWVYFTWLTRGWVGHYLQEHGQFTNGYAIEENDSYSSSIHLLPHEPFSILDEMIPVLSEKEFLTRKSMFQWNVECNAIWFTIVEIKTELPKTLWYIGNSRVSKHQKKDSKMSWTGLWNCWLFALTPPFLKVFSILFKPKINIYYY